MAVATIITAIAMCVSTAATIAMVCFNKKLSQHSQDSWECEFLEKRVDKEKSMRNIMRILLSEIEKIICNFGNDTKAITDGVDVNLIAKCSDINGDSFESTVAEEFLRDSNSSNKISSEDLKLIHSEILKTTGGQTTK